MTETVPDEAYVSVDIEASGPIPGDYSLLAIGACLVDEPDQTFYRELKPMSDRFVADALGSGFVKSSLERAKLAGVEVAPTAKR